MSCRDCKTCTKPAVARMGQHMMVGFLYLTVVGFLFKRGFMRHCPNCKHLLRRHLRRADGSFRD
ncbi:hypothetical protein GCM10027187_40340 [Streptosporangium sandarakinum]|uniref:LITAF domain-containing protein n=1 Tax=Streptosporangium sandarakinum TaxID=1260955 RepID=A0A852VEK4_9ACTN|nr:hypothetical protein [Streptosporangium sandarakinum]NYF44635.1 hypothetical protein [Streptosporangium sandarakinum]